MRFLFRIFSPPPQSILQVGQKISKAFPSFFEVLCWSYLSIGPDDLKQYDTRKKKPSSDQIFHVLTHGAFYCKQVLATKRILPGKRKGIKDGLFSWAPFSLRWLEPWEICVTFFHRQKLLLRRVSFTLYLTLKHEIPLVPIQWKNCKHSLPTIKKKQKNIKRLTEIHFHTSSMNKFNIKMNKQKIKRGGVK